MLYLDTSKSSNLYEVLPVVSASILDTPCCTSGIGNGDPAGLTAAPAVNRPVAVAVLEHIHDESALLAVGRWMRPQYSVPPERLFQLPH